jgi:hypothetical protein
MVKKESPTVQDGSVRTNAQLATQYRGLLLA